MSVFFGPAQFELLLEEANLRFLQLRFVIALIEGFVLEVIETFSLFEALRLDGFKRHAGAL